MSILQTQVFVVEAYARLHMGFFDLHGGLGRKFGSLGLGLASPATRLKVTPAQKIQVYAGDGLGEADFALIEKVALALQTKLQLNEGLAVEVQALIPSHMGLGSGTQLHLTLLAAFNQIYQCQLATQDFARLSGRGGRSGISLATFQQGGVVVDGGRGASSLYPPVLARVDFPEAWRIVLIIDQTQQGVHGEQEVRAFQTLPIFSDRLAEKLCRHVLMQALPALHEGDLASFGAAVSALQEATGDYFAPVQGGRYASTKVAQVLAWLQMQGVACLGQSSWGPTGFAIVENEAQAQGLLQQLQAQFVSESKLQFLITTGRNQGASIQKS